MKKQQFVYCGKIYFVREYNVIFDENENVLSKEDIKTIEEQSRNPIEEHPLTTLADKVWRATFSK